MRNAFIERASKESERRFQELKGELRNTEAEFGRKACVYASGSFGREEAGPHSDIDLFIVRDSDAAWADSKDPETRFGGLEEIKLKYALLKALEKRGIPEPDAGGRYLEVHSIESLVKNIGSPKDDSDNTLTARLLMLLESKPLISGSIYSKALNAVTQAYFSDFDDNKECFIPAFLINDIMRMWRTFCVNYEYYRKKGEPKSKVKNFKLKYSRMVTCYSAIVYLQAIYSEGGTVRPDDVGKMVALTPIKRLQTVTEPSFFKQRPSAAFYERAQEALDLYGEFLEAVHKGQKHLEMEFTENLSYWRQRSHKFAEAFGAMMEAIEANAQHKELYRFLLI